MPRYVARVGAAADFEKYKTFGRPDRAFTFATEPADLRGVLPAQALVKVGWTKQWMQRLVGQEVAVCILDTHAVIETSAGESHASVGPMDWPHLAEKALDDPRFLKEAKGLANISNREELAAVFQVLQQTPVRGAPNTADTAMAAKARMVMKLLDDHYSANDLFTGVGATMTPTGELGVREVMAEHNGTGFQLTPKNHVLVPIGVLSAEDLDGVP
jgi:hypothetical protein